MPWEITTRTVIGDGDNYTSTVHKPAGFKAMPDGGGVLVATESEDKRTYTLPYEKALGAKASTDVWNLGIRNTGDPSRSISVEARVGPVLKGKDRPTVADGDGGGMGRPPGGTIVVKVSLPPGFSRG